MPPKASTSAAGSASAAAKKLSPVELKLLNAGLAVKGGEMLQNDLFAACGLSVTATTMDAVNGLLRKGLAQMLRTPSGQTMFRFLGKEEAKAMSSMDAEEKLVLNHIRDAGNMGIWSRTLTTKTGLPRATIAKALKVLEGKKTIKTVKSVKTPTRKIYMLTGIAPSVELTGGPWFTDNELDVELVDTLKRVVRKFLQQKSQPPSVTVTDPSSSEPTKIKPIYPVTATPFLPTSEQVLEWISKSGAAIVDLAKEHVEDLLDLMVFDGDVEKVLVNRLGPDGLPVAARKAAPSKSKANGKKSGSKTASKRKKSGAASTTEEEDDSDESDAAGRKKGKGKRAANGKAKRKRAKLGSDAEDESDDEPSSDFDSDAPASSKAKKRSKGGDGDDEEDENGDSDVDSGRKKKGSSKRRKKRGKGRVKTEDSDDDDDGDNSSESEDDAASKRRRAKAAAADEADSSAAGGADANTQYVYRIIRQYRPTVGWTDMPCGRCPVEEFCSEPPRRRAESVRRPAQARPLAGTAAGGPSTRIEFEGGIQGIGMLGGAGAAIGVSDAKWGELKGGIGNGVAPVNPIDCPAYKTWLDF
ncbi:hypothetical protein JCM10908_007140 [Rhodotorula pacifica]|uniref:DNA-directed RNA polymerase III subunit C34 n=1 Tax=Rhodotorula pacifica TaxID=1495444 RepID=UPI00316E5F19